MRKPRVLRKGARYHVSAKINRGEFIFEPEEIKKLFLDVIKASKKKYAFGIQNFVIMNNHIHFIIEPQNDSNLSRIMQWILSVFAMYYNRIHRITGHVWQGRFFSRIIENFKQFIDTFNYISNNPVKSGSVIKAEDYKYCGLYFIMRKIFDIVEEPM